jgi:hypothetical protein
MQGEMASDPKARGQLAQLAAVAIAGTAYFVVVIVALHFLRPDTNSVDRPTSDFAVGPFGYLMTSAFVSLSVATWAIIVGLHRGLAPSRLRRAGLGVLGIWGLGLLVAATFPIDLQGAPQTLAGTIHRINGPLAFLSLVIGTNLLSRAFKQDVRWRPIYVFASVLALLMIAGMVASGLTASRGSGAGIVQRAMLVALAAWFLVTAARLRSNGR